MECVITISHLVVLTKQSMARHGTAQPSEIRIWLSSKPSYVKPLCTIMSASFTPKPPISTSPHPKANPWPYWHGSKDLILIYIYCDTSFKLYCFDCHEHICSSVELDSLSSDLDLEYDIKPQQDHIFSFPGNALTFSALAASALVTSTPTAPPGCRAASSSPSLGTPAGRYLSGRPTSSWSPSEEDRR